MKQTLEARAIRLLSSITPEDLEKVSSSPYAALPYPIYGDKIKVFRGYSRLVIVAKAYGFVLKTARVGMEKASERNCLREKEISAVAKKAGLSNYFANYLGEVVYKGRKYYLFEKFADLLVKCENEPYVKKSLKQNMSYHDKLHPFRRFVKSDKTFIELASFLNKYYLLGDLHYYNIAFSKKRKHAVIIDFAGY